LRGEQISMWKESHERSSARHFCILALSLLVALLPFPHTARTAINERDTFSLPVLFADDFEKHPEGGVPNNWEFIRGQWGIAKGETKVLQQTQMDMEYAAYAIATWQDYSITSRFKIITSSSTWGAGIVAYWRNRDNHYRFYVDGIKVCVVKVVDGKAFMLAQTEFVVEPRKWYRVKLRVANIEERVEIRGKIWSLNASEPANWMLSASDTNPSFKSGLAGFWTACCDAVFGELVVTVNPTPGEKQPPQILFSDDFQNEPKGRPPSSFTFYGGSWIIDRDEGMNVCRQVEDETPLSFDENAFAIVQWRDYTVTARFYPEKTRPVWGCGVIGYYTVDESGEHFYRLWHARGVVMLDKRDGEQTFHIGSAPTRVEEGKWCTMQMRLQTHTDGLLIRVKVWSDEQEPREWLFEYLDRTPLKGGQAGVLVFRTRCAVDDFKVFSNTGVGIRRRVALQVGKGGFDGYEEALITNIAPKEVMPPAQTIALLRKDKVASRMLLRFDLSSLPSVSVVRRAILSLYALRCDGNITVGVFRVLKRWEHGKANWLSPNGEQSWNTPGGDFPGDGNNSPRLSFKTASAHGEEAEAKIAEADMWVNFDVTEAVKAIVEGGAENNGFLLTITSGKGSVEFISGSSINVNAPKLTIEYELPQPHEVVHTPLEYWGAVVMRKSLLPGPPRGFFPDGVVGEYYDDEDLETYKVGDPPPKTAFSKLVFTRKDEMIDFRWDIGASPHPDMGSEFWSVRWQGRMFVPHTDEYVFHFENLDDAARLYIDGKLVLDAWKIQMPTTHSSQPIALTAGFHDVLVEYYQGPGPGASIRLTFSSRRIPKQLVVFPEGVKGDYYDEPEPPQGYKIGEAPIGPFFQRYIFSRVDLVIDHDWNTRPHPDMSSQYWGVKWQGQLLVPEDGEYQFFIEDLDDAARLWIDGELVIDEWRIGPQRSAASKKMELKKGLHDFKLEFYQGPPPIASIKVMWKGPSFEKELIPPVSYFGQVERE